MVKTTQLPRRKNMRLEGYDYTRPGVYFVTICVTDHEQLFGTIEQGDVSLTACGEIVRKTWEEMAERYPYVAIDDFVVMPNHMHGLLVLNGDPEVLVKVQNPIRSLSRLVASFKTLSAKRVNAHRNTPGQSLWQQNYWDRIVRNEKELNRIREYILCNPSRWEADRLNPDAEIRMNESVTNRKDVEWMV
jgi:REP element-mobilizing transposase RayT